MPALAALTEHKHRGRLTRYEYYLPLADVLMALAEWKGDSDAEHYAELAKSFANDVLNLANLASRLLWAEGVSPDIWRSPDIVTVSVDTESYFVMLQSACDMMADVIATLGATKKGQVPFESFHRLNNWARDNSSRLRPLYHDVASAKLWWFDEINGVRTKLVHRGGHIWIYTERVSFIWSVHPPEKKKRPRRSGNRLLSALRTLTSSMLKFSAKLARVIAKDKGLARFPRKYILSGVFIPGIRHLLEEYTLPQGRNMLQAKCLAVCGDYPSAASFDYPNGFWWKFLLALAELIGGPPLLASMPLNVSGQVHDYVVVFHNLDRRCGIVACEQMVFGDKWMKEAALAVDKHAEEYGLQSTVLVAHSRKDEGATEDVSFEFVISDNPTEAAESIARRWAKTLP